MATCLHIYLPYYTSPKLKISVSSLCRVQEHGGDTMIPFSGVFERSLADMAPDEAAKYCEENKLQRLGIKEQHLANE